MKWVLWILLILTLCAIVAGLAVLLSLNGSLRTGILESPRAAATVEQATITLRPTRTARPSSTATAIDKATPATTVLPGGATDSVSPSALPATETPAATHTATLSPAPTRTPTSAPTLTGTPIAAPSPVITPTTTTAPSEAAAASTKAATTAPSSTPSKTPRPTRTATAYPIRAGWTDHSAADFRLALPDRWQAVNVTEKGIEAILETAKKLDSEWAQKVAEQYSAENLKESVKFWATDTKEMGGNHATMNVVSQELPESITLNAAVEQVGAAVKNMGVQIVASSYRAKINGLDAARLTLRMRVGSVTVQEYTYLYKRGDKLWAVTYGVDQRYWNTYASTFDASARSFRADLTE